MYNITKKCGKSYNFCGSNPNNGYPVIIGFFYYRRRIKISQKYTLTNTLHTACYKKSLIQFFLLHSELRFITRRDPGIKENILCYQFTI